MSNIFYVRQNGYKDCGPSCLLSIMKYYGCEASHEEVTQVLKTDKEGTNALNIINGSRLFGFDGYGIHLTANEIINKKIAFPIICHVVKDNMYHFIVVYGVKKNKLYIMDPSSNMKTINKEEFEKIYLGTSIFIYPIKDVSANISNENIFTYLITFIKLEKYKIIKLLIFSILSILLSISINYYSMILIDYVIPNYNINFLIKISIMFLTITIFKDILDLIKGRFLIEVMENVTIKFNNIVTNKLFNLPYQFFKNKSTGEVSSRINDLKSFREIIFEIIINVFINMILVIISVIILLLINTKLFMIYLFEMILYFLIVIIYRRTFKSKNENMLINDAKYNKCLNENICAYESNLNINVNKEALRNLEIQNINSIHSITSYSKSLNNQSFIKNFIVNSLYIFSLFLSIIFIHSKVITIGEFFLFNGIVYYFTEPLKNILDFEPSISYIKNIYNRINDLLIYKNDIYDETNETIKGNINIKNLSYSYNGYDYLINNVNIDIKYGSKYLIYGSSGNGKSTIIKIILKYLNEYKGDIYINNINIKDINKNIISNSFTYVSQNSYIKNDTLKNNIIYYRDINNSDYERMIHLCNLDKLRNNNKLRDNFMIEDDGFNISGGESQKIVLARSLLKKSNFIILDEALSEVSVEEEKQIIERIFNLYKSKTIIYISHKKEIIDIFKEKYKLERSKIC